MNIKKRNPIEIKKIKKTIMKHSFGFEDLKNEIRKKHGKPKQSYVFQKPSKDEPHFKIYKNGFIYKTIDKNRLKIWQELLKKGLMIEEIESTSPNLKNAIVKEMKENGLNIGKDEILVKTKVGGISLASGKYKTMPWLLEHFKIDENTRIEIAKQMIKTITLLHNEGYIHGHPHIGNWVIDLKSKKLILRLIDLDKIKKASRSEIVHEMGSNVHNSINNDISIVLRGTKYFESNEIYKNFMKEQVKKYRTW